MRLIDAIGEIADYARLARLPMPHILMPRWAVNQIARCIETDIGGTLYQPGQPVQFDGVTFAPLTAKPRVRVKAGRRVISQDEYFWHGVQWTPEEVARLRSRRPTRPIKINRVGNWMT